jgi:hypothetical protein
MFHEVLKSILTITFQREHSSKCGTKSKLHSSEALSPDLVLINWLQSDALCIAICGSSLIQDFKKEKKRGNLLLHIRSNKKMTLNMREFSSINLVADFQ